MKNPKFNWIVIPVRNCLALTKQCIETCLKQDIGDIRIMVIDDGSTDGTHAYLRTIPQVTLLSYRTIGVTKAWNKALEVLFYTGEKHVLCINNDVKLREDTYSTLVNDGGMFVTCVGTSSGSSFPGDPATGKRRPNPDFSCFLIRKECWYGVGHFDEQMQIYCSDGDYHLRMDRVEIEAYCIDLSFFHYASGTLKSVSEEDRERILQIAANDRKVFKDKWGCEMGSPEYYAKFGKLVSQ